MFHHATQLNAATVRVALIAVSLLAAAALATLAAPAPASAKTKVETLPAQIVFAHAQRPGKPGDCSAVVFLQWPDVKNATAWKGFYTYKGVEQTKQMGPPPFDDTYKWVATYTVPPGSHWSAFPPSWRNGATPNDCSDMSEKQKAVYGTTARVEVTVEIDEAACKAARTTAAARVRKVNQLKARVARATGAEKKRLKRALTAAKTSRDKAAQKVAAVC